MRCHEILDNSAGMPYLHCGEMESVGNAEDERKFSENSNCF
jgi:hypothetical protein